VNELGPDKFEIVVPSVSILAEPPVTVVDGVAKKRGTEKVAQAYLEYLYSPAGQKLAAAHYYRPIKPELADPKDVARFPKVKTFSIDDLGGWKKVQETHFADGGVFDQIYSR
jgi:sulfate/thiosulfate transport system substrate-binding protein